MVILTSLNLPAGTRTFAKPLTFLTGRTTTETEFDGTYARQTSLPFTDLDRFVTQSDSSSYLSPYTSL
jgi:hypothetical protein